MKEMRTVKISVAVAIVLLLLFSVPTFAQSGDIHFVHVNNEIAVLFACQEPQIVFTFVGDFWAQDFNVSGARASAFFNDLTQNPPNPGITFGVGCDPKEPTVNLTIARADTQEILLLYNGGQVNESIFGRFYYGSMGTPAQAVFNDQTYIQRGAYLTDRDAFVSSPAVPSVYLNYTGGYVEWRIDATLGPETIAFTRTTQSQVDCSNPLNWPSCVLNYLENNTFVLLIALIFGGLITPVQPIGKKLWQLARHRHKREQAEEGHVEKPKNEPDSPH
jgi:hypothetical protein